MAIQSSTKEGVFQRKAISGIITFVILFMAAANGIFTYSGAYLYLDERLYAVLFAIAVQFTIAASLIAFPFVHGLGKISLITVYIAALILSTLAAYTNIYNSSLPGDINAYTIDTELKSRITNDLSDVVRAEENKTEKAKAKVSELKRLVDEEAARGGRSGLGPGKGIKYYAKLDKYESAKGDYEQLNRNLEKAQAHLAKINTILSSRSTDFDRDKLLVEFSGLRSSVNTKESQDIIESISKTYLGNLQNPVERAVSALLDMKAYSIQLIVSVIWAAVFDIIALFLGIVRYYLLRPEHSMLQGIYDSMVGFTMFITRVKNMPDEVRMRYHKEHGLSKPENEMPLNSAEMQTFATKLLAGSQMANPIDDDPAEPIQTLVSYIEPLDIEGDSQAVGISFDVLDEEPRLSTLLAMLIQTHVFLKDSNSRSYILNSDEKLAQKVMVMIRMGMKDDPKEIGIVSFLMDESDEPVIHLEDDIDSTDSPNEHSTAASWGNMR